MVNYSTSINKTNNHLSSKESLNSDGQLFYQYQQNKTITSHLKKVLTVMVNYSTNISKTNNHFSPKESINSDGQLFYQYQQNKQSPLT